ncbi:MAG: glycoside hydrolase family 9 protein [Rhizobiaceae bacterium]
MEQASVRRLLRSALVFFVFILSIFGGVGFAQISDPKTVNLKFHTVENVWNKARLIADDSGGAIRIRDGGASSFDDASLWDIKFDQPLPYGRKTLSFNVTLGDTHKPLWGKSLFQPLLNGRQAEPARNAKGLSYTPIIASDGRNFVPVGVQQIQLNLMKATRHLRTFSMRTAGAKGMDIALSNFTITVWPEVDNRVFPQRPFISVLPLPPSETKILLLDIHDDAESMAQKKIVLRIEGPKGGLNAISPLNAKYSIASASNVSTINLSGLQELGDYTLTVPATGKRTSPAEIQFSIGSPKSELAKHRDDAWGTFYWVTDNNHGPYKDAHFKDIKARIFAAKGKTRDVRGGWFDAGDYGKYTVNGAYSVSLMLLTGLHAPEVLSHSIYPLAGGNDKQPDWLDVASVELDWLLKMQGADGGVSHKATSRFFPNMDVTPFEDDKPKWVMPTSSPATADFAATMNLAALIYDKRPGETARQRAEIYRNAAAKARLWLANHPHIKMAAFKYGGFDYGGPYHDDNDKDERFFAAAAFAAHSGKAIVIKQAMEMAVKRRVELNRTGIETDWRTVDLLGFWALKLIEDKLDEPSALLVNSVLDQAASSWSKAKSRSPWRIANPDRAPLYWGSNGVLATAGWHWLLWSKIAHKPNFAKDALDQLHWFFGRNPLGKIFVTGAHPRAVKAPHFRPWSSGAITLPPGFLAGGSNSGDPSGDPAAERLKGSAPMRIYSDAVESYATNEVAINWQAPWALYLSLAHAHYASESN